MNVIRYIGAHDCANCPMSNDPAAERSCPDWWEWVEERGSGAGREVRANSGCGRQISSKFMQDMMANNVIATNNIMAVRDELSTKIQVMGQLLTHLGQNVEMLQQDMREQAIPVSHSHPVGVLTHQATSYEIRPIDPGTVPAGARCTLFESFCNLFKSRRQHV